MRWTWRHTLGAAAVIGIGLAAPFVGPRILGALRPALYTVISGNNQTVQVSLPVPQALVVHVTDSAGRNVIGDTIVFHVTAGAGTLASDSVQLTATGGLATLPDSSWTLGISAGTNTVTALAKTLFGPATNPLTFTAVGTGSAVQPTLETLSRDIGAVGGGTKITARGYHFGAPATVTVDGNAATAVTVVDSNTLTFTTPSDTGPAVVSVTVKQGAFTSTLSNAFEYLPAIVTTYADEDFHTGTLGAFTAVGNAHAITSGCPAGLPAGLTSCVVDSSTSGGAEASISLNIANTPMIMRPHGLFQQFFVSVPAATIALMAGGSQIKLGLTRVANTTPDYLMPGFGPNLGGGTDRFNMLIDNGTSNFPGSRTGSLFDGSANWIEVLLQMTRDTIASKGTVRVWINGKKLPGTGALAALGDNVKTNTYTPRIGIVFTSGTSAGNLIVYEGPVLLADGFRDKQ